MFPSLELFVRNQQPPLHCSSPGCQVVSLDIINLHLFHLSVLGYKNFSQITVKGAVAKGEASYFRNTKNNMWNVGRKNKL